MAKVRVYDLAREFGMKGKELADRLVELGYAVTSHSSTLEDDMVADIRRKMGGEPVSPSVSVGRIEVRGRSESSGPWGGTVVRRRSKADKEEAARQQELAETRALEEEAEAARIRLLAQEQESRESLPAEAAGLSESQAPAAPEQAEAPEPERAVPAEAEPGIGTTAPSAEEPEAVQESGSRESAESRPATAAPPVAKDQAPAQQKRPRVRKVRTTPGPGTEPERPKPLARIVGRMEIPVPSEASASEQRPARPKPGNRPAAPAHEAAVGQDAGRGAARGGKKKDKGNRRVVAVSEDEALDRRMARGSGRKGKGGREDFLGDAEGDYTRQRGGRRKKSPRQARELPQPVAETRAIKRRIKVVASISVADLARHMSVKATEVITALMKLGVMATVNQALDVDTAALVATDFGFEVEQAMHAELEVEALEAMEEEQGGEALPRPPVVTVMGHVDHGKTSILDAIRKTDVALGEAGGITQHIGAYHVQNAQGGGITFVDTPGHAAFTEMRSRGAQVTDIVVLVVAADDGVMEQTKEAIAHAKAAEVPIVVAVNKIDKPGADAERVRRELSDYGLIPEDWGGQTIYCETSAKKGLGIPELLESIQIQADILELKADPSRKARGVVIEAQLHKGRGPVATVLVQEGTLRPGDNFVAGMFSGRVRLLSNERGERVKAAGPAIPVEIQGLSGVPSAGDPFMVVTDEKMAKAVASARQLKARETELASASKVSLDNLFEKMAEQDMKELKVILRADVQGTLEAFGQAAENLSTDTIRVHVLHEGTGSITENDIHLASASDAIVIGFNVRPSVKVKELAGQEGVDVRAYDVIYHALEDIEKAMKGMLEPTFEERVIGTADVRQTFQVPKVGLIAGCTVLSGKMQRNAKVRVLREGVVIYTGKIASLKRFKDDAKEVLTGFECGIGVERFNDIKVGDQLEAFVMDEVEATL